LSSVSTVAESSTLLVRLGGWLFRHRTALPIPLAIPILFVRTAEAEPTATLWVCGLALVAIGEVVRLWGVRHIGVVSRTRSDRLGPLVATGPFAVVRNPLYLGNIAIWIGFALLARLVWMAPLIFGVLALEYHAIVRWEERLLESRLGDSYRAYLSRVPRWIPGGAAFHRRGRKGRRGFESPASSAVSLSWRETFFSEIG